MKPQPLLCLSVLFTTGFTQTDTASKSNPVVLEQPQEAVLNSPPLVKAQSLTIKSQPPAPPYPDKARQAGIQGDLLVEIWLGTDGLPTKFVKLFGPTELFRPSVSYLSEWKFAPYVIDGKPTSVKFRMLLPFKLAHGKPYESLPKELKELL
jgi:outer membrane biosynthesis protein TonB